jgi:lon-related putative ATP-dependent protease
MEYTRELTAEQVTQRTDPEQFAFETTADLEEMKDSIGQARAADAIQFGVGIERDGYNIFALGPMGMDKQELVRQFFETQAQSEPVPSDWCYVHDFDEPHQPQAIELPAGKGHGFRQDMQQLVEELQTALSSAFESEEYQTRQQVIQQEFQERQQTALKDVQEQADERNIALLRTPAGLAFAPVRDGEVLSREEVDKLSQEEREKLEKQIEDLQEQLQKAMRQMPGWQREMRERLRALNDEVASVAVGGLIDELREKYKEHPEVVDHLDAVRNDVIENARQFLAPQEQVPEFIRAMFGGAGGVAGRPAALRRYEVNVLIDHGDTKGAPVVYEDNPTFQNLVGRVEHVAQMGALLTDFQLIKPGSLHKANGGYLILDARKLLQQPYAWEGIKRALQSKQIRIESVAQMLSMISTISLDPEPIPLDVKVAIVGERLLYYMLYQLDPEFPELFKVAADFEETVDRNPANQELYARMIGTLARSKGLRPFDRGAVARVIDHSARVVEDSEKLTTHRQRISDLLCEADYWAEEAGHVAVTAKDVEQAIDAQIHRVDRIRERSYEAIKRGTVLIDTEGSKVGQVNGLSVIGLGNFAFGRPSRITARIRMGKGDVVDIEREVELGGPIHSKGVMILYSFLGGRYADDLPLSLSASLVFEQSYGGVEGDSASSAELYALLSAISEVPIKQNLAVTGSVNQHGQVQAIGGVNWKIEGFFDVCNAGGLTGDQGVLIPVSNVKNLMLRQDVVEAIANGAFHIYAVETVDQGIEILTGVPAGERDQEGNYPEGSINYLVQEHLEQMAEKSREMSAPPRQAETEPKEGKA